MPLRKACQLSNSPAPPHKKMVTTRGWDKHRQADTKAICSHFKDYDQFTIHDGFQFLDALNWAGSATNLWAGKAKDVLRMAIVDNSGKIEKR